jgi:hypothetical protein
MAVSRVVNASRLSRRGLLRLRGSAGNPPAPAAPTIAFASGVYTITLTRGGTVTWRADGATISGQTGTSYTRVSGDNGKLIEGTETANGLTLTSNALLDMQAPATLFDIDFSTVANCTLAYKRDQASGGLAAIGGTTLASLYPADPTRKWVTQGYEDDAAQASITQVVSGSLRRTGGGSGKAAVVPETFTDQDFDLIVSGAQLANRPYLALLHDRSNYWTPIFLVVGLRDGTPDILDVQRENVSGGNYLISLGRKVAATDIVRFSVNRSVSNMVRVYINDVEIASTTNYVNGTGFATGTGLPSTARPGIFASLGGFPTLNQPALTRIKATQPVPARLSLASVTVEPIDGNITTQRLRVNGGYAGTLALAGLRLMLLGASGNALSGWLSFTAGTVAGGALTDLLSAQLPTLTVSQTVTAVISITADPANRATWSVDIPVVRPAAGHNGSNINTYWGGHVGWRDQELEVPIFLLPWKIDPTVMRANASRSAQQEGRYPCGPQLGMEPSNWQIGGNFSSATNWNTLELTLDDKLFLDAKGTPPHNGPSHCFYTPDSTLSFGHYCGTEDANAGTLPRPTKTSTGWLFDNASNVLWIMALNSNPAHYQSAGIITGPNWNGTPSASAIISASASNTHKTWIEVIATGGTFDLFACKEAGLEPIFIREVAPGDAAFPCPAPLGYLMLKAKTGNTPKLVRFRQFLKGETITGWEYVLPWHLPATAQIAITAAPGTDLTIPTASGSITSSYNATTGIGAATVTVPTNADTSGGNVVRITGHDGSPVIPAGGYRLKLTLPENAAYGTRAEYGPFIKQHVDDMTGLSSKVLRTLDYSALEQRPGDHCSIPASTLPGVNQHVAAGLSPEDMVRLSLLCGLSHLWMIFPHACGPDYIRAWVQRAITARGSNDLIIIIEWANEAWNEGTFGAPHVGNNEAGDKMIWYSERYHDIIDQLDANIANWRTSKIMVAACWQSNVTRENLDAILLRTRASQTLLARMAGAGGFGIAPYFAGGTGGVSDDLSAQYIVDQAVAGSLVPLTMTKAAWTTHINNLVSIGRPLALNASKAFIPRLRQFCKDNGQAFDALQPLIYEVNRHTSALYIRNITHASVSDNMDASRWATFREALYDYEDGAVMGDHIKQHLIDNAALGFAVICHFNAPTGRRSEYWQPNGKWGSKRHTGAAATVTYTKISEALASINAMGA